MRVILGAGFKGSVHRREAAAGAGRDEAQNERCQETREALLVNEADALRRFGFEAKNVLSVENASHADAAEPA
jgi:hypothetical protein